MRFYKSLRSIQPIASATSVEAPPAKATRIKSTDPTGQAVAGVYGTPERGNPEPLGATIDPDSVSQRQIDTPPPLFHFFFFLLIFHLPSQFSNLLLLLIHISRVLPTLPYSLPTRLALSSVYSPSKTSSTGKSLTNSH